MSMCNGYVSSHTSRAIPDFGIIRIYSSTSPGSGVSSSSSIHHELSMGGIEISRRSNPQTGQL